MHDFGSKLDLTHLKARFKKATFYLKAASAKARTLTIDEGPGTTAVPNTPRWIWATWADGSRETISSYDLEVVIKDGKEIKPLNTELGLDVDITPKAAIALQEFLEEAPQKPQKQVRRKR